MTSSAMHVIHVWCLTCNTYVEHASATGIVHLYFYKWNTCVQHNLYYICMSKCVIRVYVMHLNYLSETYVLHVFYI